MKADPIRSPLNAAELVDEYFIENRTKLLDIAAFLDRVDRADPSCSSTDFRMRTFLEALAAMASSNRIERVQMLFSDPTREPLEALDRKGAVGAFDDRRGGARTIVEGLGNPDGKRRT